MKSSYVMIIVVLLGLALRVFLVLFASDQLYFDAASYHESALQILGGQWGAECCNHNAGYSLFVAGIYSLFGDEKLRAMQFAQIILDLGVAAMLYRIGKALFSSRTAFYSFTLYLLNPLTSSYAGLLLSETLALFLVTCLAWIIVQRWEKYSWVQWGVVGMLMGLLVFVKLSFYYFSFLVLIGLWAIGKHHVRRIGYLLCAVFGFFIASLYSLLSYHAVYGVWTISPPYSWGSTYMYTTFFMDRRYPELNSQFGTMNPEYAALQEAYYATPLPQIPAFTQKYDVLLRQRLRTQWPTFINNIVHDAIWMWDKNHLYVYEDPFFPADKYPLEIANMFLILLAAWGIVRYVRKKGWQATRDPMVFYSVSLALFMTVLFPLVTNETRHTIPYYPLLFLWAGNGVAWHL